ncbi:MAG: hypothetical protein HKO61_10725 [Flavobacteriaceae bacterium]|nr:hypothetical protein [Flavobacteriaceae bacterium]
MKTTFFLVLILSSAFSFGQIHIDSIDWKNDAIGYACSVAGSSTNPVSSSINLLKKRRYKPISQLLYSDKPSEQFMAVLLLEQFHKKGDMVINDQDMEQINLIRKSYRKVPVCSGCTYWAQVTLYELLNNKVKHEIYLEGITWFDYYYQKS